MRKMGTIWECIMCGKSSKYKNDITRHIEANHISSPGIKCEICDKISPTREALRQHNKIAHQWKVKISNNIYIVNLWLIEIYNETNKYLNFKCQMFEIHQKNEIYFVGKSLKLHFNYRLISINSSCFRIIWSDCHQNGPNLWWEWQKTVKMPGLPERKIPQDGNIETYWGQSHTAAGFQCQFCPVASKTRNSLRQHMKLYHQ